jgi:hypothetical protein
MSKSLIVGFTGIQHFLTVPLSLLSQLLQRILMADGSRVGGLNFSGMTTSIFDVNIIILNGQAQLDSNLILYLEMFLNFAKVSLCPPEKMLSLG